MDLLARLKAQPLPFAALLGIDLRSAEPEKIVGEMTVRPEFCTRPAVLHGGAIMAFADTLGALATIANLKDERARPRSKAKPTSSPRQRSAAAWSARRHRSTAERAQWCGKRALRRPRGGSLRS